VKSSRIRRAVSVAASVLIGASALVIPAGPALALPGQADSTSWTPVWSDEFDGAAGSAPDAPTWSNETGDATNYGNRELQYYTAGTENVAKDGAGNLVITARKVTNSPYTCGWTIAQKNGGNGPCDYTSARVSTRVSWAQPTYGRVEARIALPGTNGTNPAFWMLGTNSQAWPRNGEMDIMESPVAAGCPVVCSGVIGPKADGTANLTGSGSRGQPGITAAQLTAFNVYAIDWYPDHADYSVNGKIYYTAYRSALPTSTWVFDRPFYLVLNVAAGGNYTDPDPATNGVAPFTGEKKMTVDYVRYYQRSKPMTAAVGTVSSAYSGYKCVDLVGGVANDNAGLQTLWCKNNLAQQWSLEPDGTVRSGLNYTKCLEPLNGATGNGTRAAIYPCANATHKPWQQWRVEAGSTLRNTFADKCLHIQGASTDDGAPLEIFDCDRADAAEQWSFPSTGDWPLHDNPGKTGVDAGGNGNTATCDAGQWWTTDPTRGWVAELNGTDGACTTERPAVNTGSNYTVSAWVKLNTTAAGLNRTALSQDGDQLSGFYLQQDPSVNKWSFKVPADDSAAPAGWTSAVSTVTPAAGAWTLLTGVYDGNARNIKLYVNGALQATTPVTGTPWGAWGSLAIGRGKWAGNPGDFFPGRISGVRTFQYALSAAQIATLNNPAGDTAGCPKVDPVC